MMCVVGDHGVCRGSLNVPEQDMVLGESQQRGLVWDETVFPDDDL